MGGKERIGRFDTAPIACAQVHSTSSIQPPCGPTGWDTVLAFRSGNTAPKKKGWQRCMAFPNQLVPVRLVSGIATEESSRGAEGGSSRCNQLGPPGANNILRQTLSSADSVTLFGPPRRIMGVRAGVRVRGLVELHHRGHRLQQDGRWQSNRSR